MVSVLRFSFFSFSLITCALSPLAAEAGMPRDALTLYAQLCANCHGANLEGNKAQSLLDSTWTHAKDDAALARVISKGVLRSGMPAFSATLSEAEIRALVILIRESRTRHVDPAVLSAAALPAGIQTSQHHSYRIEKIVDGLDVPWSLAFLPDGRLLFTERNGGIFIATPGDGLWKTQPVTDTPKVWVRDEGGLMALSVPPDYAQTGWIYLTLSDPGENDTGNTKLVRGRIRDARWTDEETLFEAPRSTYTQNGVNFGGRVVFSGGYVFLSFGERGEVGQAQDLSLPNGKIHRLLSDGGIPKDNPFVKTQGALPSIWSYGHRNPQGLAVHPVTGELWETEHGPRGGDELNYVRAGRNYGWPIITHGMNYSGTPVSSITAKKGMEQPVLHWTPSIAVSPIRFYTGDAFPKWKNQLFLGALAQQELRRLDVKADRIVEQELILKNLGRVRDMITGPEGYLYVSLELPGPENPAVIVRLVPAE
ncbi:MAG: PQQ-dependent sugar dehydrogenase [Rariglobus sp.]